METTQTALMSPLHRRAGDGSELQLELLVRQALERAPVQWRDAEAHDGLAVLGRRVTDVLLEPPAGMQRRRPVHEAIARDLRDDRRRRDGRALGVAVDDRPQWVLELLAEREAVAQAEDAGTGDPAQGIAQRGQVRAVQPAPVDPARAAADDVHLRRDAHDPRVELLARLGRVLL